MKKGAKIATIVLAVLAAVMIAFGVIGLIELIKEQNSEPTPFEIYAEKIDAQVLECEGYLAQAEQGMHNMEGMIEQLNANRSLYESAGKDTKAIDDALAKIVGYKEQADTEFEALSKRFNDLITPLSKLDENTPEDELEKANNNIPKHIGRLRSAALKITKFEDPEETPSFETKSKKLYSSAKAQLVVDFPDLDLSEQFVPADGQAEIVRTTQLTAKVHEGFQGFLLENWDYCFWIAGVLLVAAALCFLGWKKPEMLKKVGSTANKNMMLVALVVITLLFFVLTRYKNLTPANIYNVINQYSYIIILATGMLLCIVSSANIDLSVGRVMGFIAACAAKFVIEAKMPVGLSMVLCLMIGLAIGAWQGFWIAYVRIPAFVVTLAGQLTFYGLTMVLLEGETLSPFPNNFNAVFGSALPDLVSDWFGLSLGINLTTLLVGIIAVAIFIFVTIKNRVKRIKKGYAVDPVRVTIAKTAIISVVVLWLMYSLAQNFGLPSILITVAIVLIAYTFLTSKTVIGRHLYAMGGNVNAARLSGVKTQRMLFLTYVNMGFLAALAGLAYAVRMNSASPMGGQGEELNAIAACYIGGASAYGGIGTVGGAVIGALTMGIIKNGMSMMGMKTDIQQVVLGLVLLMAVVTDIVSKSGSASLPFLGKLHTRKEKKADAAIVKT